MISIVFAFMFNKSSVRNYCPIHISTLKKAGLINKFHSGFVTFNRNLSENVRVVVNYNHSQDVIEFSYPSSNNSAPTTCFVGLSKTPCHFGGLRLWFTCPNPTCQKRVAILYFLPTNNSLFCRHCLHLTYPSQQFSGSGRYFMRWFDCLDKFQAVFQGLQRVKILYKGLPTRRFQRYMHYSTLLDQLLPTKAWS
jgi:hypothetical protein